MSTMDRWQGPWRRPGVESVDLYPGLVVCDDRVTGSITVGRTRLPVWAFASYAIGAGWDAANDNYDIEEYGFTEADFCAFVANLMELRGEFGRLLLVLADAERRDHTKGMSRAAWWETKRHRKRVGDQLRRCLSALEQSPAAAETDKP